MKSQKNQKKYLLQHWRWLYEFKISGTAPSKIIKSMEKLGFKKCSQKGSHAKYINYESSKIFIIPIHSEVAKGTLRSILEQADIELEEFLKNL